MNPKDLFQSFLYGTTPQGKPQTPQQFNAGGAQGQVQATQRVIPQQTQPLKAPYRREDVIHLLGVMQNAQKQSQLGIGGTASAPLQVTAPEHQVIANPVFPYHPVRSRILNQDWHNLILGYLKNYHT